MKKAVIIFTTVLILFLMLSSCIKTNNPKDEDLTTPINIYPAQAEVVTVNNFYARWTNSTEKEGAVRYTLTYARSVEGLEDVVENETENNYYFIPHLESGVWYWQVKASLNGKNVNSPVWTFTVDGQGLPVPVEPEKEPADPQLIVSEVTETGFTLDWEAYQDPLNPVNPVTYTINLYEEKGQVSNRRQLTASQNIAVLSRMIPATTVHTTDTSHTFINLPGNSAYLWTLIAGADASRTTALGSGSVKTGNRIPTQPELLTPANNATDVATDVTLSWSESIDPDNDPLKYYIYIDTKPNPNRTDTLEGIQQTSYQPQGIEKGRTYYWFILVKDDNGGATRTQTHSFSTQSEGMGIAYNPTPADGSQAIDALDPPLLQWEHDTNAQPITYSVYLSSNPNTLPLTAEELNQQQYQIPETLKGNTTYYWQIEAKTTQTGQNTKSGVWTFKTDSIPSPIQTQAQTNREGTQIELTYDKAMTDPTGKHSQYTVKKITGTGQTNRQEQTLSTTQIEPKPGTTNQYILSLETAVENTDEITIDYTRGTIQAQDGSYLNSYTHQGVENKVPGENPDCIQVKMAQAGNSIYLTFSKAMQELTGTEYEQFGVDVNGYVNEITGGQRKANDPRTLILT